MRIWLVMIILAGVTSCQSCQPQPAALTPIGKLSVMTMADDQALDPNVGPIDVTLARFRLTADMASDLVIAQLVIVDDVNAIGSARNWNNCELWVPAANTKVSNTVQPIGDTGDYVSIGFAFVYDLVIPAGTTTEVALVGDLSTATPVGAIHKFSLSGAANVTNSAGESVPVIVDSNVATVTVVAP